jgi:hypothetical protein
VKESNAHRKKRFCITSYFCVFLPEIKHVLILFFFKLIYSPA